MPEASTDSLFTALLAVQSEAPTLPKDKSNPAFRGSKYTDLATIVEQVAPVLQKHGLVWTTLPGRDEAGDPTLAYRLIHATSGESLDGSMPLLLAKNDSQGFGSAITYARRYALCAVLNLVADEDDDGNAASTTAQQSYGTAQAAPRASGGQGGKPSGKPSTEQEKLIKKLITQKGAKKPQVQEILRRLEITGPAVEMGVGWVEHLSAGKEGTASQLISYLIDKPLPDLAHPTDVPTSEDDFAQPDGPTLEDEMAAHGVPDGMTEDKS